MSRLVTISLLVLFSYSTSLWSQTKPRTGATPRPSAPVFDELDGASRAQLDRVRPLVESGQVDEAIEILQQIIAADGEKIVEGYQEVTAQLSVFSHYTTAREFAYSQLASIQTRFPKEFAAYRRRIDPIAARWLQQGIEKRDDTILLRICREMFLSSSGDDALAALGEIALERRQYNLARYFWERVHPTLRFPQVSDSQLRSAFERPHWLSLRGVDVQKVWPPLADALAIPNVTKTASTVDPPANDPPANGSRHAFEHLVYPDTDLNLAEMRARLALVSILEGNVERAAIEINILRQLAPSAAGKLAGREGNFVELLEALLAESRRWPDPRSAKDWVTYTGDPSRQHMANLELPETEKPLWTVKLPRIATPLELLTVNRARVNERAEGILAYHPLIVGDRIVIQAGDQRSQVMVCDATSGELQFPVATPETPTESQELGRGTFGVPRFTNSAVGDLLFVRTGIPLAIAPASRGRVARPARLEALSLSADGKVIWDFGPQGAAWGDDWTLGAVPVSDGKQLLMALIHRGPLRVETHLAAFDFLDGRLRWRKFLCAAEPAVDDTISLRTHTMLTLSQGAVYCNTNQGVVAACDAETGEIRWLTWYPRTPFPVTDPDRNDLHFYRDLNPCVVFRDLVIVAPTDCNRLFALDANSGVPIWVTQAEVGADVVHFLGVGGNNLLASGECLYWFDVYTGRLLSQFPGPFLAAPGFARPVPRGYGRGILAGSRVYWPTYESIFVFEQQLIQGSHGSEPVAVREFPLAASGLTGGNLVAASDVLLIAGAEHLAAFRTLSTTTRAEPQEHGTGRRPPGSPQAE